MELGPKLAEGKTKIIYAHPSDPALAIMVQKDSISAGDGARRNVIPGKGALSGRTAANVFALLNRAGIATHFVAAPDPASMVVRRCAMIPLEVVMRRRATGSYLKRHPEMSEGTRFDPPLVEFFLKDDARHDPQISPDDIAAQGIATAGDVELMTASGRRVFEAIERAWAEQDITLIDLKIEFGRPTTGGQGSEVRGQETHTPDPRTLTPDPLVVADMIDNDSWRLWPGGDKSRMIDKQVYRNMSEVTDEGLEQVRQLYETVADLTDAWRMDEDETRRSGDREST
jgi:phosphoribosylaminoimidazole-succinocarboxamide synthase